MESLATGEVIQSLLKKTTIPLCWDDPKYASTVTSVLSGSFDSKGKKTKGRGKEVPLTNVILAANFEMDDDLRVRRLLGRKLVEGYEDYLEETVEGYEDYLEENFLPYVRKIILQGSNPVKEQTSGFDEFIECFGKSLINTTVPDEELRECMKNNVPTRHHGNVMHIILPNLLAIMKRRVGPRASFNLTKLRKAISEQEGASVDHSSCFGGAQRKCVKIPREVVNNDVIALIDKAFGDEPEDTNGMMMMV
ncbi:Hypothetical predicted protein [Paramuricea clavata]|uniref:Uncharacterized protein n=1 Tax=Paramuricea clavata TaxID=317549 RepID=A0A6S7HYU9_PARCT|nr:Hypothetical predicted protein [Paramuricea clavata]